MYAKGPDSDTSGRLLVADVLVRQDPDEDDEEEGDGERNEDNDDSEDGYDGYSE
jgi:hypothetical protein